MQWLLVGVLKGKYEWHIITSPYSDANNAREARKHCIESGNYSKVEICMMGGYSATATPLSTVEASLRLQSIAHDLEKPEGNNATNRDEIQLIAAFIGQ